ncbi:MAG: hypothetical protein DRP92_06615 [Candidatus Neomarinimicrobiota bacterium]|nr:MAG: hypothetical protein DRP92_06615 [Candidatus Neomarinimicrobiota bacterium]
MPSVDSVLVYFNGTRGKVTEIENNAISVIVPKVIESDTVEILDSVNVLVSVIGAYHFGRSSNFKAAQAVIDYARLAEDEDPYGIACDKDENLYVSLAGKKVVKISPDGSKEVYATTSFDKASNMIMGPDGYIYYVNILNFVFRIVPDAGKDELFVRLKKGVCDLDFAPSGNILYCGGKDGVIYGINVNDKSFDTFAEYNANIKALRVYNNYLYVAAVDDSGRQYIYRNPILEDDTLGESEVYFDWNSKIGNSSQIQSMTFSNDGCLYVGTDVEGIIEIKPDKTFGTFYEGLINPTCYTLRWGNGNYLYVTNKTSEKATVIRIDMREKVGAPYYGRK